MQTLDGYLARVEHLPPAPVVATQLLTLFSDPDRDIDRIVELISYDPALTAEVLKRCNSVFFAGSQPATGMFEAVFRLGFYEVYCVVVTLVGSRAMSLAQGRGGLDTNDLWRHSVTTAMVAATLAQRVQELEATAFTAGLLHDVGKLILASVEGAAYAEVLRQAGRCGPTLAAAEEAALGFNHADIGARLLARWGLPAKVCLAVLHHHASPAAAGPFQRLAAAVHFANALAHQVVDVPANAPDAATSSPEAMALLELTAKDIPEVVRQTQQALQRIQGLLQLKA